MSGERNRNHMFQKMRAFSESCVGSKYSQGIIVRPEGIRVYGLPVPEVKLHHLSPSYGE